MPTFARVTLNTATYAPFHPTYPRQLFDVFKYHESSSIARWNTAVDLEVCKPTFSLLVSLNQRLLESAGQAIVELTPFKRVIGVDPSAKMIKSAREMTALSTNSVDVNQFEYLQSSAEDPPFLEDEGVDLVVLGEYRHVRFLFY